MNALSLSHVQLRAGDRLDRYELLAPIGDGGFGQVWVARLRAKRRFEKLVAIKVPRFRGDERIEKMLLDEARIAAAIDHENVVRVLDFGEMDDMAYVVMEWIEGESLSVLLHELEKNRLAFPVGVALRIVSDLCGAAHAAHEVTGPDGALLGVVHRDISPQNIIVTRAGRAKLIDFGVAKARDRASDDTGRGKLKGKLRYMAPEQASGLAIDRRADVFALGAILFRLVTGRAPYEGEGDVDTFRNVTKAAPVNVPRHLPPFVRQILRKALAASPHARFGTALDMQHALTAAMAVEPLSMRARVSAMVREHLHARMEWRRRVIKLGVQAAAERSDEDRLLASGSRPVVSTVVEDSAASVDRTVVPDGISVTEMEIPIELSSVPHGPTAGMVGIAASTGRARSTWSGRRWGLWLALGNLCLLALSIAVLELRSPVTSAGSRGPASATTCRR